MGTALAAGGAVAGADTGDTDPSTQVSSPAGNARAGSAPARTRQAGRPSGEQRRSAVQKNPKSAAATPVAAVAPTASPAAPIPTSATPVVSSLVAPAPEPVTSVAAADPVMVVTTRRDRVVASVAAAASPQHTVSAKAAVAPARDLITAALMALGWGRTGDEASAVPALAPFTGQRYSAAPAAVIGTPTVAAAPPDPTPEAALQAAAVATPLLPGYSNGVTGVQVGHSRLEVPGAFIGDTVAADWYFPTQADGSVQAQGVIWLQHGFGATNTFYSALAQDLAQQTNSIVVAPTLSSIPFTFSGGCLICATSQDAAAAAFLDPNRTALVDSAVAAGYTGDVSELQGKFALAGHSAGGGFATAVAADYIGEGSDAQDADLIGVVMYDGVSNGALDGTFTQQVTTLKDAGKPIYQIAAPAQTWNAFGMTTNALVSALPGQFAGVVLSGGSHVDSMLGVNPIFDAVLQLVTQRVPDGNTAATYTLSTGWLNDMYAGLTPQTAQYGFYAAADQQIIMGPTSALGLPSPVANQLSFGDAIVKGLINAVGGLFGFHIPDPVNTGSNGLDPSDPVAQPALSNGVTGVRTGTAVLDIPCGDNGYATPADWYFPTQADGSVTANGVIWLQHGFLGFKSWYADMAQQLAQETNSIVVVPNIFWFDNPLCPGCYLSGEPMRQAVASMFLGSRSALNVSANAAGYSGALPQDFILTGHSAGGNFATAVGADYLDAGGAADALLGVVMFDGVAFPDLFESSIDTLTAAGIPDYQIAGKPQPWNAWGRTTEQYASLYPDQFIGVQIDNGSHTDVVAGPSLFAQLAEIASDIIVKASPDGAKAAVRNFAGGWINDIYAGLGPQDPQPKYGIYGNPNDGTYVENQRIVMGEAGATTLPAPPPVVVDPNLPPDQNYLGTWYEQGSVRQFFSIGLVNTKATYSLNPDGSIKVENSGNYFGPNGPAVNIVGSALPANSPTNTRLNVAFFFGQPNTNQPGNYWILDYAPDYSWAIVGDSIGYSGYILTREQTITDDEYNALVARAKQLGVWGPILRTQQFPSSAAAV